MPHQTHIPTPHNPKTITLTSSFLTALLDDEEGIQDHAIAPIQQFLRNVFGLTEAQTFPEPIQELFDKIRVQNNRAYIPSS